MISPFGFPFDDLYKAIKKACDPAIKITRADQALQLGFVMCQRICRKILSANLIFADISNENPNVYYEIGLSYIWQKPIILLCSKSSSNKYRGLFKHLSTSPQFSIIEYSSINDLKNKDIINNMISNPIKLDSGNIKRARPLLELSDQSQYIDTNNILPIVNGKISVTDIYSETIKSCVAETKSLEYRWNCLNEVSLTEDSLIDSNRINEIISYMTNSKITIIDTTHYHDECNPYVYFFLGIAHGLQRDVIPITNTKLGRTEPFDIRGLWQIYFDDLDIFSKQFVMLLSELDKKYSEEKKQYYHKIIFDRFANKQQLEIVACARNQNNCAERGPGARTNIDLWDYQTVSELSSFLSQLYQQTVRINLSNPVTPDTPEEQKKVLIRTLSSSNSIIIGSADVSKLADNALSKLHNIRYRNKSKEEILELRRGLREKGFIFYKSSAIEDSVFYSQPDENNGVNDKVIFYAHEFTGSATLEDKVTKCISYGVLTIAANPFVQATDDETTYTMILSGYTGVSTFGLMRFLTMSKQDDLIKVANILRDNNYPNIDILVKVEYSYSTQNDLHLKIDNRIFEDVKLLRIADLDKSKIIYSSDNQ
jgi:hypothetical protein